MINCPSVALFSSHIVYRVSIACLSSFSTIPYRAVSCRIMEFHDLRSTIPDTAQTWSEVIIHWQDRLLLPGAPTTSNNYGGLRPFAERLETAQRAPENRCADRVLGRAWRQAFYLALPGPPQNSWPRSAWHCTDMSAVRPCGLQRRTRTPPRSSTLVGPK